MRSRPRQDPHATITRLREKRGWNYRELAEAVRPKTDPSTIWKIERGRGLTLEWIDRLAKALEVDPVEIFTGHPPQPTVPVLGYIGKDERYYPDAKAGEWAPFREAIAPEDDPDLVALEIKGSGLQPSYPEGSLIYFRDKPALETECGGVDCVVKLKSGLIYLKYADYLPDGDLAFVSPLSPRGSDEDIRETYKKGVEWCTPVLWIKLSDPSARVPF